MSQLPQDTIELSRGYIDADKKAHRKITLRAPTLQDEIESEKICAKLGLESSDTAGWLAMVLRCIVQWDGIPMPEMKHLLALTRDEGKQLVQLMLRLENSVSREEMGNGVSEQGPTP
ncbi:MAG: hypothetical protein ACNA8W_17895 [Bradymonadaceae bacterium]